MVPWTHLQPRWQTYLHLRCPRSSLHSRGIHTYIHNSIPSISSATYQLLASVYKHIQISLIFKTTNKQTKNKKIPSNDLAFPPASASLLRSWLSPGGARCLGQGQTRLPFLMSHPPPLSRVTTEHRASNPRGLSPPLLPGTAPCDDAVSLGVSGRGASVSSFLFPLGSSHFSSGASSRRSSGSHRPAGPQSWPRALRSPGRSPSQIPHLMPPTSCDFTSHLIEM